MEKAQTTNTNTLPLKSASDHLDVMNTQKSSTAKCPHYTTNSGAPVDDPLHSLTVGAGQLLAQDILFFEKNAHFNRERIPERVVHAKGAGAHGHFEVTKDMSQFTKAKLFQGMGSKTQTFVRFSLVLEEKGHSESVRDLRGFSIKFYTEDGNFDLVANNLPVFWIRDPIQFADLVHSQKRCPRTNLKLPDTFWDFLSFHPESIHTTLMAFGDRGIPKNFRQMNGYGNHTFKLVNAEGKIHYCKFHVKPSNLTIEYLTQNQANEMLSLDSDHATRDLFEHIEKGEYPEWIVFMQIMTEEEAANFRYNIFDVTKVWPHGDVPLVEVGRLQLNRNQESFFAEVEQVGFCPGRLVPGIEPTPDPVFQSRLIAYTDAQRYRLGVNHEQIPINAPQGLKYRVNNEARDGFMVVNGGHGRDVNYNPTMRDTSAPIGYPAARIAPFRISGIVARHPQPVIDDDFVQPRVFWQKVLDRGAQARLVANVISHMSRVTRDDIKIRALRNFHLVDPVLAKQIAKGVGIKESDLSDEVKRFGQMAITPKTTGLQEASTVQ